MTTTKTTIDEIARKLANFYDLPFGGKPSGRYRISPKNLRSLANRRRISDKFVRLLTEEMFELGYVFIDMESYYAVSSARTLNNYRRITGILVKNRTTDHEED
ncbi:MAG: hypothetical protein HQ503_07055 [Rhodospirillales bacterium]|nr:hypothetical protein [Rhodospirillales bacterium]